MTAIAERTPGLAWATVFLIALTLWMIFEIVLIRFERAAERRRDEALTRIWEPLFFATTIGDDLVELPRLRRRDRIRVLTIWCRIGDYVVGDSQTRLNVVGRRLRLERVALAILKPGWLVLRQPTAVETLLAIRAAERLRLEAAWPRLARLVVKGPAPLDRYAARALVALDAPRAAPAILPALVRQGRWARHLVEDLVEAGADAAVDAFARLLVAAPDDAIPGLALLLDRCRDARSVAAVRTRLGAATTQDPEALAALLNTLSVVGDVGERHLVRTFVAHEQWIVRMRAAQALGRCGDRRDAEALTTLLGDSNWYTRYHAARAILNIAELGEPYLAAQAEHAADRYARDMARHVIAEIAAPAVR